MRRLNSYNPIRAAVIPALFAILCWPSVVQAGRPGWQHRNVNWPMSRWGRVISINYPEGQCPPLLSEQVNRKRTNPHKVALENKTAFRALPLTTQATDTTIASVVDSPPLGGFLSWITVTITDEHSGELELDAVFRTNVSGQYLTSTPQTDYAIAVFDTGAGAHIISSTDAARLGLFDYKPNLITSNMTQLMGVSGSINAWVSQPLGVFIDGFDAIEPNELLTDTLAMVGQTNVSIVVGDPIESPDLLSIIGTPLSVYLAAAFYNDRLIAIKRNGIKFSAPDIRFYAYDDPYIPTYANVIPLELRPIGSVAVQYFPNIFDPFDPEFGSPLIPSVITGFLPTQALFFVTSVDLTNGSRSTLDKDGFIFDTGSTYTLISKAIGARLGLNPNAPNFELEILTATGEIITAPGYYIDSLDLVASPEWLRFTNVPVVMLDSPSPEGGLLDGIIGMNLFADFNLVFRGGGLPDQDQPRLEFEPIQRCIVADIAPGAGDGAVNSLDLAAFAEAWLTNSESFHWNPRADLAPQQKPDGVVNLLDFTVFAQYWLETCLPSQN